MDSSFSIYFYSCANKNSHTDMDNWLEQFLKIPNLGRDDREVLQYTLEASREGGFYPPWDYYSKFYSVPDHTYNIGELAAQFPRIVEFYRRRRMIDDITTSMSTTGTTAELSMALQKLLDDLGGDSSSALSLRSRLSRWTYTMEILRPYSAGIKLGIPEIDDLTNGFQSGNIVTIGGFTGHGKSQMCLSTLYKAASQGKKCVYVSLELPANSVWLMLETRYMYEVKGIHLNSQDLLHHKVSGDRLEQIKKFESSWESDVQKNIHIIDESFFSKEVFMDTDRLREVWSVLDADLGGLDLIVIDHVGQLDLMYTERGQGLGNKIIVKLRQSLLSYVNSEGNQPVMLFAAQTNRQGFKRAERNGGRYDTTALSDLNEIERSSSYICFIFSDGESCQSQQCKVCMTKHRFGAPLPEPVVTTFLPGVCTIGETIEAMSLTDDFSTLDGASFGGSGLSDDLNGSVDVDF